MKGVEAPQGTEPVIGVVGQPVGSVHGHHGQRHEQPAGPVFRRSRWIELRSTEHWPGWLLMPLTVVAMDGANWLAHYADHRPGPLWRFHALHHSQEELSVLTSFRAHPLMHTTGFLLATVPVVAL